MYSANEFPIIFANDPAMIDRRVDSVAINKSPVSSIDLLSDVRGYGDHITDMKMNPYKVNNSGGILTERSPINLFDRIRMISISV
jgi:hypothetical protein